MNDCLKPGCRGVRPFSCGCCAGCWGRLPPAVRRAMRSHYRRLWSGSTDYAGLIREEVRVIGLAVRALAAVTSASTAG